MPSAHRTARARAREQITDEVLAEARRQIALSGPGALSLRSVARQLGMVSSAVYRYFDSRDALLTRLIIDAYDDLGATAEAAAGPTPDPGPPQGSDGPGDAGRWMAAAAAIRAWALARPHEYALLYGTPVPGYAAPEDTVGPGTRVSLALVGVVVDASAGGRLAPVEPGPPLPPGLADDLAALAAIVGPALEPDALLALLMAWTQLFGLLSFELFNQTRGMVSDNEALFTAATARMAHAVGLR